MSLVILRFLLLDKEMMGSSGEMATTEQMKGEWVVCSDVALSRVGQMEKQNQMTGLSYPPMLDGLRGGMCACMTVSLPVWLKSYDWHWWGWTSFV